MPGLARGGRINYTTVYACVFLHTSLLFYCLGAVFPYILAEALVELPYLVAQASFYSLLVYWCGGGGGRASGRACVCGASGRGGRAGGHVYRTGERAG